TSCVLWSTNCGVDQSAHLGMCTTSHSPRSGRPRGGSDLVVRAPRGTAGVPAGQPEHRESRRRRRTLVVGGLFLALLRRARGELIVVVVERRAVVGGSLALDGGGHA